VVADGVTASGLAEDLTDMVVAHVTAFAHRYAPAFDLPRVFAGFPVGSDVRADFAFTLAQLHDAGVNEVAGTPLIDAVRRLLGSVDGNDTHTFSSYRVAETLHRFGPLADNEVLAELDPDQRRELVEACDSTSWFELLGSGLPANYAAVLARCELARRSLGLPVDQSMLNDLVDATRRLISANSHGFIDDSEDGAGARYDIYSADVYLFTETFATELQPAWDHGARNVLALVADVVASDGSAMAWGRSLGVLAVCHTVELGALALRRDLSPDRANWLHLIANATRAYPGWTDGLLVTAHKHRSQNRYRGPSRWLQLNFDCLGKLAWAANQLRGVDDRSTAVGAENPRDELIWFDEPKRAGVWTFRTAATSFVVPLVGTAWSDYLPAPRAPGLYEVPVDAALPTAVPVVAAGGGRFVAGGLPVEAAHVPNGLDALWSGFPPLLPTSDDPPLPARRSANFRVAGHVLEVTESLDFDAAPDSVTLQIAETRGRPLRVEAVSGLPHRVDVIDTEGLAAYRSFWAELPRVHQIEVEPRSHMDLRWSVRPLVRIATPDLGHHYHRSLYDPLADAVIESGFGAHLLSRADVARERLTTVDGFHLHWPEWFVDTVDQADVFTRLLDETRTTLIWTQHNLRPHRDLVQADEIYQRFASAAALVIHHSEWGRRVVQDRYRFRDDAVHLVLPHGHFGRLFSDAHDREDVERELDLQPCRIRIAIIGAPRREKDTQGFMEAFASTSRTDLQLLVLSLNEDERVPDDPRIRALPYEFVSRDVYNSRLAAVDAVALPFEPDGQMLTTGVVGDVVGLGLPAIASSWPYLTEALGESAIVYRSDEELIAILEALTDEDLAAAHAASVALQDELSWDRISERFFQSAVAAGVIKV
jgi:hypothetical protein